MLMIVLKRIIVELLDIVRREGDKKTIKSFVKKVYIHTYDCND